MAASESAVQALRSTNTHRCEVIWRLRHCRQFGVKFRDRNLTLLCPLYTCYHFDTLCGLIKFVAKDAWSPPVDKWIFIAKHSDHLCSKALKSRIKKNVALSTKILRLHEVAQCRRRLHDYNETLFFKNYSSIFMPQSIYFMITINRTQQNNTIRISSILFAIGYLNLQSILDNHYFILH